MTNLRENSCGRLEAPQFVKFRLRVSTATPSLLSEIHRHHIISLTGELSTRPPLSLFLTGGSLYSHRHLLHRGSVPGGGR